MPIGVEIKGTAGFLKRIHGRFLLFVMHMDRPFDPPVGQNQIAETAA